MAQKVPFSYRMATVLDGLSALRRAANTADLRTGVLLVTCEPARRRKRQEKIKHRHSLRSLVQTRNLLPADAEDSLHFRVCELVDIGQRFVDAVVESRKFFRFEHPFLLDQRLLCANVWQLACLRRVGVAARQDPSARTHIPTHPTATWSGVCAPQLCV